MSRAFSSAAATDQVNSALRKAIKQREELEAEGIRSISRAWTAGFLVDQVKKDLGKAIQQLEELEAEVARKKEVSRRVKELRRQIAVGEADCQAQAATQQHLTRQQAALHERLTRLDQQVSPAFTLPSPLGDALPVALLPFTLHQQAILRDAVTEHAIRSGCAVADLSRQ